MQGPVYQCPEIQELTPARGEIRWLDAGDAVYFSTRIIVMQTRVEIRGISFLAQGPSECII